jgi:hypothetical protein
VPSERAMLKATHVAHGYDSGAKQSGGSGKPRVGDVEYSTDYPFPSVPGCIGASVIATL